MDIKEFEKYTKNLGTYTALDVRDFSIMSIEELENMQHELEEYGSDDFSDFDYLRMIISFRAIISELKEHIKCLEKA